MGIAPACLPTMVLLVAGTASLSQQRCRSAILFGAILCAMMAVQAQGEYDGVLPLHDWPVAEALVEVGVGGAGGSGAAAGSGAAKSPPPPPPPAKKSGDDECKDVWEAKHCSAITDQCKTSMAMRIKCRKTCGCPPKEKVPPPSTPISSSKKSKKKKEKKPKDEKKKIKKEAKKMAKKIAKKMGVKKSKDKAKEKGEKAKTAKLTKVQKLAKKIAKTKAEAKKIKTEKK